MSNPYNLPDRALEQSLANGVSKGIQQAQSRQQTLDGLTNIGMALWDLSDQKKLRKLKEWVYLVIDKSCLRNPKLQDLVDLDAWVQRIASHGRPSFGVEQAANELAQKINQEFSAMGHDADQYIEESDYYLDLKIRDQNLQAENYERKRLYGKASSLPFANPRKFAAKISEILTLHPVENEEDEVIAEDERVERFSLLQKCPTCEKEVHSYDLFLSVVDYTLEHQVVLAQYHGWAAPSLYGDGFSVVFVHVEDHEHLVPDARGQIYLLLDCESFHSFREADTFDEVVQVFLNNGIELLELTDGGYDDQNTNGDTKRCGVIVNPEKTERISDYIVSFMLWNGQWGLSAEAIDSLSETDYLFHSTGLAVWIECSEGYQPDDKELAKWAAIKEFLAPNYS